MKSLVIDSFYAIGTRLPRAVHRLRHGLPMLQTRRQARRHTRLALSGAAGALLLSGCYYPYGYYPGYYPPYYATVPASATQREVPLGTVGDPAVQQQSDQQAQQLPQQSGSTASPPTYVVAQPPVYVAPPYPAYYPPPVYPPWYGYGYPGWYGPAVSIGFGWSWGGHGHHHH